MMAGLFLLMGISLTALFIGRRNVSITVLLFTLILCALMLWHHATDTLQINP